jgi:hypothetical protein
VCGLYPIPSFYQERYQVQHRLLGPEPSSSEVPFQGVLVHTFSGGAIPEATAWSGFQETPLKIPHAAAATGATATVDAAAGDGKHNIQDVGEDSGKLLPSSIEGDHDDSSRGNGGRRETLRILQANQGCDNLFSLGDLNGRRDLVALNSLAGFEGTGEVLDGEKETREFFLIKRSVSGSCST